MKAVRITTLFATVALAGCTGSEPSGNASNSAANAASDAQDTGITVPGGTYVLDPTHAILQFSLSHFGTSDYHARFDKVDARITLDSGDISRSSIVMTVDPKSVDTNYPADYLATHGSSGYKSWTDELGRSAKFLDGDANPVVTFRSTRVEQTGPRAGKVTGDLSFRGVTRPITMNVRFIGENPRHLIKKVPVIGFEANGEILRTDFGMKKDALGPTVKIYFNGEFLGQQAASATPPAG